MATSAAGMPDNLLTMGSPGEIKRPAPSQATIFNLSPFHLHQTQTNTFTFLNQISQATAGRPARTRHWRPVNVNDKMFIALAHRAGRLIQRVNHVEGTGGI